MMKDDKTAVQPLDDAPELSAKDALSRCSSAESASPLNDRELSHQMATRIHNLSQFANRNNNKIIPYEDMPDVVQFLDDHLALIELVTAEAPEYAYFLNKDVHLLDKLEIACTENEVLLPQDKLMAAIPDMGPYTRHDGASRPERLGVLTMVTLRELFNRSRATKEVSVCFSLSGSRNIPTHKFIASENGNLDFVVYKLGVRNSKAQKLYCCMRVVKLTDDPTALWRVPVINVMYDPKYDPSYVPAPGEFSDTPVNPLDLVSYPKSKSVKRKKKQDIYAFSKRGRYDTSSDEDEADEEVSEPSEVKSKDKDTTAASNSNSNNFGQFPNMMNFMPFGFMPGFMNMPMNMNMNMPMNMPMNMGVGMSMPMGMGMGIGMNMNMNMPMGMGMPMAMTMPTMGVTIPMPASMQQQIQPQMQTQPQPLAAVAAAAASAFVKPDSDSSADSAEAAVKPMVPFPMGNAAFPMQPYMMSQFPMTMPMPMTLPGVKVDFPSIPSASAPATQ